MSITATCTSCGRNFFAPAKFAGKRVKCKGCGEVFAVPGLSASSDAPYGAAGVDVSGDVGTDPLHQLAAVAVGNSMDVSQENPFEESESENNRGSKSRLAPNILTFNYPGADDVDKWMPIALIVLGFLLLLSMNSGSDSNGVGWISFTRFLAPSALFLAFTYPITLTMLKKAGRELRYAMPPNPGTRCLACYMPAFVLMTWAQFAGEGLTIVQLFAGILGVAIASALLWLFFRLREEHIGTTVAYGAGGFAAGAAICCALLLGMNKIGALIVTSQHSVASVPVSPFGSGFSWPSPPPPLKTPAESTPIVKAVTPEPAATNDAVSTMPPPVATQTVALGQFDPGTIPGVIGDLIDPLSDSPFVCVIRSNQNGVAIESWNTQTWEKQPGTLQLTARPTGNLAISADGQRVAYISEFPRFSVQIWSFPDATVAYTVDLDRSAGPVTLVGFVDENTLMIDRVPPDNAPAIASTPAEPTAPADEKKVKSNIFDDMNPKPVKQPAVVWADGTHGSAVKSGAAVKANGQGSSVLMEQSVGHQMSIVDVTTGNNIRSFNLPVLCMEVNGSAAGGLDAIRYGQNLAVSVRSQRLVAACKLNGVPSLVEFDLSTGKPLDIINITKEIEPGLLNCPTGLAYSNDGQKLAALFENGGSAFLLWYDSATGANTNRHTYPAGPLDGAPHWLFRGSAVCWLDPSPYWLIYGQGIVSTKNGKHIPSADLHLSDAGQQRCLSDDRLELLTNTTAGKKISILQLDRSHLDSLTPN